MILNLVSQWWFNRRTSKLCKVRLVNDKMIEHFNDLKNVVATGDDIYDDINKTEENEYPMNDDKNLTDYIKNFVLAGKFLNQKEIPISTELNDEQNKKYFAFRDNVMQSSSQFNSSDIMNKVRVNDIDFNGRSIKGVYDDLIKDYKLYDTQKIITPEVDNITNIPFYKIKGATDGEYIPNDIWVYDKDKVMNGSKIFDSVYPSDRQQKIKYKVV